MVTTALELPGYRIVRNLGVVRGIVVRSRNLFATLGAGLQTHPRRQYYAAHTALREDAAGRLHNDDGARGTARANAVIMARYDANELMQGVTEVLAYGTAVVVEKL